LLLLRLLLLFGAGDDRGRARLGLLHVRRHRNGHDGYGVVRLGRSGFALFTRLGRLQDSSCVRLAVGHLILAAARRTSGYRDLTTSIGGQRLRLQYGVRRLRGPGLSGPVFQTLAESRFSPN
jgi:hypothetical protein